MLTTRALSESDYDEILVGWWNDWGWTPPMKDFLPENGRGGLMVMDGDEPVCAGYIYITNSKAAWCDWIISSKTYRKKPQRREALRMLVESLTNVCKEQGYKYTYALIKSIQTCSSVINNFAKQVTLPCQINKVKNSFA